jgi:sugar/nucleoside kinase (ribokinase family)
MRYASWSVIVDDIVFPDGRTAMGVLGGGGSYTAAGMRVWSHEVSVLGNVGADFDPVLLGRLDLQAIDLRSTHRPTPRAWQLFEDDGQRTQIPRIPLGDWSAQVGWSADLPERLQALGVGAVHLLSRGDVGDPAMIARIAASGIRVSLEPVIEDGMGAAQCERVLAALAHVEIFSPGLGELQVLLGAQPLRPALVALAERGPALVALRRGAAGSLVYHRESRQLLRVPAAHASVADVTGAGNAYAGGMLVGWCMSAAPALAAACAAVSAAIAIEQVGPPAITRELLAAAVARRSEVLAALHELEDGDNA